MAKLTYKQKDILRALHLHKDGGTLRGHKAANGSAVFRLMDAKLNPVTNFNRGDVYGLFPMVRISGQAYTLDLERIREANRQQ